MNITRMPLSSKTDVVHGCDWMKRLTVSSIFNFTTSARWRCQSSEPPSRSAAVNSGVSSTRKVEGTLVAKAGIVHSVSGWTRGVQVKLWDPLRARAIPERLRGVFTTRHYTNPRLPYLTLPNDECKMG